MMITTDASAAMGDLIETETPLTAGVLFPRLSRDEQTEILQRLDAFSAKRDKERYEKLAIVEAQKQQLLRELDATDDRIFDNDNWLAKAKEKSVSQADPAAKLHLDSARLLSEQKHRLQDILIPTVEKRLKEVIEDITHEEAAESRIRSTDLERLLAPLRETIESSRLERRSLRAASLLAEREQREAQRLAEAAEEERKRAHDFWAVIEPVASPESIRRRSTQIRDVAHARQIPFLVHFTPLNNVRSIIEHGLMSKSNLQNKNLEHICTDNSRGDGWLDWISLSIAFPNYKMLTRKRKDMPKSLVGGWAIVRLQPRVLWELNCKFMITNAANSSYWFYRSAEQSSPESFELMFAHTNERQHIPYYFTTDPQAEVMAEHAVPIKYIEEIVTANSTDAKLLTNGQSIPVSVDPHFFAPRSDWKHWKERGRLRPHSKAFDAYIGEPA